MTFGETDIQARPEPVPDISTSRRRLPGSRQLWALAHAASLAVAFVVLLRVTRGQWFSTDEWDFLMRRGLHRPDFSIWEPHNEHWSTIPILIYRALYTAFGLRTYTPYLIVLFAFHLLLAHLLWRVMLRTGVGLWLATAAAAVFAVLGAGHENLLWAFQIGFVGSVTLGIAVVLLVDHDGPPDRRDAAAMALAVVALTFSGITVTMVLIAGLTAAFRRRLRVAALMVLVPAAVYLLWFVVAGRHGLGAAKVTKDSLLLLPDYVWFGMRVVFESPIGIAGGGSVVLLVLLYWMTRRSALGSGRGAPAFAMAVGAVALFGLLAVGRSALGVEQAGAQRYTYIGAALMLPAAALALEEVAAGALARRVVVLALLGLVLIHNVALLRQFATLQAGLKRAEQRAILARAQLAASGQAILEPPVTRRGPGIPNEALRRAAREGKLPSLSFLTAADRLAAATAMQLAMGPTPAQEENVDKPRVVRVTGAVARPNQPGCVGLVAAGAAEVELSATSALSVRLEAPVAELSAFLRSPSPVVDGPPRKFPASPEAPAYLDMSATGASLVLQFPPGQHVLCGLAP